MLLLSSRKEKFYDIISSVTLRRRVSELFQFYNVPVYNFVVMSQNRTNFSENVAAPAGIMQKKFPDCASNSVRFRALGRMFGTTRTQKHNKIIMSYYLRYGLISISGEKPANVEKKNANE